MVLVLLTLLALTAGVTTGVVLRRRAKKRIAPKERGKSQVRSNMTAMDGARVHTCDVDYDDTCIDGRVVLYQGLDVGTQDYASVYTQLRWGTYQELDPRSTEEHHYQRANKREGHGRTEVIYQNVQMGRDRH